MRSKFVFLFVLAILLSSYKKAGIELSLLKVPLKIRKECFTANTATLNEEEKNVVLYMNIARCYPKYFLDSLFLPYAKEKGIDTKTMYYTTLVKTLRSMKPVAALTFYPDLYPFTLAHAQDMGKSGLMGHKSSKGVDFDKRLSKFNSFKGEDCQYGYNDALDIVMDLILDEGIPSLGHRENILMKGFARTAVSIQPHKTYGVNCVIDFTD
ncbi:MAG TPA: CAP domain-containing protein [Bacteroidia bacterium]